MLSLRTFLMYLIIVLVVLLCAFSLYLSTQILSPYSPTQTPNNIINNDANPTNYLYDDKDQRLNIAVEKSLHMYLLRKGHIDRVKYMIGYRVDNVDVTDISELEPRHRNKTYDRDYIDLEPIAISGWQPQPDTEYKCDAHCIPCTKQCDVNGVRWSMENVQVSENENVITGSTRLDSKIPVPYFSYWDFGFMTPVKEKDTQTNALSAAFISNCGFPKRNAMVRDLQKYGVSVDSFGRCENNKDEERNVGGREQNKISMLSKYKFSLAFENSETDDYISEKFFGTLVSGSVPVYIGAPNIKFFAPDAGISGAGIPWKSHAVIYAGDFDFDAEKLAQHMLYLDRNHSAYNEYIQWKHDGYSGDFKALVELTSATHTNCRQCILATDWQRYKKGNTKYDEPIASFSYGNHGTKWLFVRERGMYRFTLIKIEQNTLKMLVKNIMQSITPKPVNMWKNNEHPHYDRIGPAVYAIYHIPSKIVINSDESVEKLLEYVELEVIFV